MFRTFNSVVLAVAALIIVYVTVIGVMATAQEGEFLGKHWHKMWTPLRMVLGIVTLFPTTSGYSGIQIIMMWVILQGVGAADTVWNTALNYVNIVGSPFTAPPVPRTAPKVAMQGLFQGLVCDATLREQGPNPDTRTTLSPAPYYCNPPSRDGAFCNAKPAIDTSSTSTNQLVLGPGGACGTLTYCNVDDKCKTPSSLACQICKGQVTALASIVNALGTIATAFEQTDYSYRNFYFNNNAAGSPTSDSGFSGDWLNGYCSAQGAGSTSSTCCVPGTPNCQATTNVFASFSPYSDPIAGNPGTNIGPSTPTIQKLYWTYSIGPQVKSANFLADSTDEYVRTLGAVIQTYISANSGTEPMADPRLAEARDYGWILAGGYYYFVAQTNSKSLQDSMPVITMTAPGSSPETAGSEFASYRVNYSAAQILEAQLGETSSSGSSAAPAASNPNGPDAITNVVISMVNDIRGAIEESVKSGVYNPLMQMQTAGDVILWIVQIVYPIILILTIALGLFSGLNGFILGTGMMNPASTAMILVYFFLMPAIMALLGILMALGGTLAIYLPLIPFTIFTMGAIGWLLSTIETMVAGPLVALGILSPGGRHEILGSAEPALMLMFSVFLRPALMIFGLIAAMLLASVVMLMINKGVWTIAFQGILGESGMAAGPLGFIIFLCAYVTLVVSAMNKCFEAIHLVPEKVMRWIGGQGDQHGEGQVVGEMKRGVEGGVAGAKGAGESGKKGLEEGKANQAKAKGHAAKQDEDKGPNVKGS